VRVLAGRAVPDLTLPYAFLAKMFSAIVLEGVVGPDPSSDEPKQCAGFGSLYFCCGCKTWSVTLREEQRLRLSENRVLRRLFGHKRDEVTEGWRRLHNEELNDLY
jgi:hypothetical protein